MDPLEMSYFCLAGNDQLLEYWDRVADRLFKVRHCMNIEGVERELPLFEPPIDPALLVRAAAAGVDLTSVLNDLNMPLPHHRFTVMFQKAVELCSEVKSLGTAFLGALEKRDAEMLALLRSEQEVALLKAIRDVRQQQLKEAEENEKALEEALNVLLARKRHYENLVNSGEAKGGSSPMGGLVQAGGGSLKLNRNEQEQLTLSETGLQMQAAQSVIEYLGGILSLIPDTKAAAPTSAGTTFGGSNIGGALKAVGGFFGAMASISHSEAALSGLKGGHLRRSEEWAFQLELANQEEIQINRQLAAANIRVALAEKELENHDRQIENAGAVDDAMRNKFTNSELYGWMIGQLSTLYFQGYNLAYNAAKKAERAYRFELGIESSSFVQYGYWDSLKKGLLAGDKLSHDLRRLDMSYSDLNRREYEITKHVSLLMLDPLALLDLKMTGTCQVDLPEVLFDLDCPGHYMRRIKSVGVTIPCVVGPYASLNCKLTLLKSETRYKTTTAPGYARTGSQDTRFADYLGAVNAMVTSNAQNDSGLFEANLRDERYLPFEGSGAISQWRLQLPKEFPQFDYESISDVILHLRYTARDGGDGFRSDVNLWLQNNLNSILQPPGGNLARFFSMRHEFPSEWNRFMTLASANGDHEQKLILTKDRFPFFAQTKTLTVWKVDLFGLPKPKSTLDLGSLLVTPPQGTAINLAAGTKVGELEHVVSPNNVDAVVSDDVQKAQWTLKVAQADIQQTIDPIHDLYLVCHYRMSK